jgi:hypothetical protein
MEDPAETRPVRIRYFATFVMKATKNKDRVNKYKEVYRGYEKYKDILASYGIDVSTEEKYKYNVQSIAIRKIKFIDEIYQKGLVLNESLKDMKPSSD